MSTFILNQRDCYNIYPSAEYDYSCFFSTSTEDPAPTGSFQTAPGISYAPCIPNQNTPGSHETFTSEPDWTMDLLGYPSATGASKQTNTQNFSNAFLPSFDSRAQHLWQLPAQQLVSKETVLSDIGDKLVWQSSRAVAPESLRAQIPNARLQRNGGSSQSAGALSRALLRHTPYSAGSDRTRRSDSPTYQCQWFDGRGPCGIQVPTSRYAIGQHLHAMHGMQLKADKSSQACCWERCRKSMRRGSIARHILEVHMQDKVLCPICGSSFARTDSMQRHQRTHCCGNEDASGTRARKERN